MTSIELLAGPVTGRRQVLGVLEVERVCFLHSLPWGRRGGGWGGGNLCSAMGLLEFRSFKVALFVLEGLFSLLFFLIYFFLSFHRTKWTKTKLLRLFINFLLRSLCGLASQGGSLIGGESRRKKEWERNNPR